MQTTFVSTYFLHFVDSCRCYFGAEKLPTPEKIRKGEPNEDAKLSEFQQELIQLAAVIKGDNILTSFPGTIGKDMTVKQGKYYMDDAVRSFFEAGRYARKMGVNEEHIVQMKPSLTTRSSKSPNTTAEPIPSPKSSSHSHCTIHWI